jgi:hypothetical protein
LLILNHIAVSSTLELSLGHNPKVPSYVLVMTHSESRSLFWVLALQKQDLLRQCKILA